MARNNRILREWERVRGATRTSGEVRLWSRFPVELAPDLIVSPHLFDWPASSPHSAKRGAELYTCTGVPEVVVFSAVSAEHRRFLEDEVVPRVHTFVRCVALVDFEADQLGFAPVRSRHVLPSEHLAPLLRIAWGHERIPYGSFADLIQPPEDRETAYFGPDDERPEDVARREAHPLRLWEAFFWRGHTYRYELINGEMPLIGDLLSPLAANRTLLQLVKDAERLERMRAEEREGWIHCGRFRMRQSAQFVEIRARLSSADVRAALTPQARVPGDEELPSVLGALTAGGDNGKTEMWNGFTWSSIAAASAAHSLEMAHVLRDELERWTETKATIVDTDSFTPPNEPREEWFLVPRDHSLTTYVPFARHDCLPWEVHAGDFWRRAPTNDPERGQVHE